MDEPAAVITRTKNPALLKLINSVVENPVIIKELRGRMRGRRAFIMLTAYLVLIGLFIGLIYSYLEIQSNLLQWNLSFRQAVGKTIFSSVIMLEFLLIGFIGPALTAGAITFERERQTYDLLRTTLLSARALVFGKLASAFMYLFLLIFTALPIEALAFLLGGVGVEELLVSSLILVVNALFFCTLGLFFSSIMKRTLTATISSYATILLIFLALGMALGMILYFVSSSGNTTLTTPLLMALWLMACSNPFSAATVSEVFLTQNQTLFLVNIPMPAGNNLSLISPWILHVLLYLGLTAILMGLSIKFVNRPDR